MWPFHVCAVFLGSLLLNYCGIVMYAGVTTSTDGHVT